MIMMMIFFKTLAWETKWWEWL